MDIGRSIIQASGMFTINTAGFRPGNYMILFINGCSRYSVQEADNNLFKPGLAPFPIETRKGKTQYGNTCVFFPLMLIHLPRMTDFGCAGFQ